MPEIVDGSYHVWYTSAIYSGCEGRSSHSRLVRGGVIRVWWYQFIGSFLLLCYFGLCCEQIVYGSWGGWQTLEKDEESSFCTQPQGPKVEIW